MDDYSFAKEDTDYSFAQPAEDYSFAQPEDNISQLRTQLKEPMESSPYGARPEIKSKTPQPKTLGEAAYQAYGAPAVSVAKYVRANPAKTALALGSLAVPEISIPYAAGASVLATAIDKLHPFEGVGTSEYKTKTSAQNLEDLLGAGLYGGAGQYLSNRAGNIINKEATNKTNYAKSLAEAEEARSANYGGKLINWNQEVQAERKAESFVAEQLTPNRAKEIRQQILAENSKWGTPNKIVTNKDVQAQHIIDQKSKRDAMLVPDFVAPTNIPVPTVKPYTPYNIEPNTIKTTTQNAVIGGILGHTLGPLGAIGGAVAGTLYKPAIDKLAPYTPKIIGSGLQAASRGAFPVAEGIVNPLSQYLNDRRINVKGLDVK